MSLVKLAMKNWPNDKLKFIDSVSEDEHEALYSPRARQEIVRDPIQPSNGQPIRVRTFCAAFSDIQ